MQAWMSSWLSDYKRKFMNDSKPWRRKPIFCFQYGYFYAQMCTCFAIVICFSSTVPLITVAGAIYIILRHVTDAYTLLTVHRKEMESES